MAWVSIAGQRAYWLSPNGMVVRLPGQKGFLSLNEKWVATYIEKLTQSLTTVLINKLRTSVRKFITQRVVGNVPIDTGNMQDSIVGAVLYQGGKHNNWIGPSFYTLPPIAKKPQHWSEYMGGLISNYRKSHVIRSKKGKRYSSEYYSGGWGYQYANAYIKKLRGRTAGNIEDYTEGDIVALLSANIPYSAIVDSNTNWFSHLASYFAGYIQQVVGIEVETFSEVYGESNIFSPVGFYR